MIGLIIIGVFLITTIISIGGVLIYKNNSKPVAATGETGTKGTTDTTGATSETSPILDCGGLYNKASTTNTGVYVGKAGSEKCYCSKQAKKVDSTCVAKECNDYINSATGTTANSFDVYGKNCYCKNGYKYDEDSDNCISKILSDYNNIPTVTTTNTFNIEGRTFFCKDGHSYNESSDSCISTVTGEDTGTTLIPPTPPTPPTTGGVSSSETANKFTTPDGQIRYCLNGYIYNSDNNNCDRKERRNYDHLNTSIVDVNNPFTLPDGSTLYCKNGYKYNSDKDNCVAKSYLSDYNEFTTGLVTANDFDIDGIIRYCKNGYIYSGEVDNCVEKSYGPPDYNHTDNFRDARDGDRAINGFDVGSYDASIAYGRLRRYCANGYIYRSADDDCMPKLQSEYSPPLTTPTTRNSFTIDGITRFCPNGYKYAGIGFDNCITKSDSDYDHIASGGNRFVIDGRVRYCADGYHYDSNEDNCV
jgi:hypothetical protein